MIQVIAASHSAHSPGFIILIKENISIYNPFIQ